MTDLVINKLHSIFQEILGDDAPGVNEDFHRFARKYILKLELAQKLTAALGERVHTTALDDAPSYQALSEYLIKYYPDSIRRIVPGIQAPLTSLHSAPITENDLKRLRQWFSRSGQMPLADHSKLGQKAIFILSAPRSGSTLLRVMLSGNPGLIAPPELNLLGFDTMSERARAYSGRYESQGHGLIQAFMHIYGYSIQQAKETISDLAASGATIAECYRLLLHNNTESFLVDKSTSYAFDRSMLRRAEQIFEKPLYIHLTRHPGGMIRSSVEARLDRLLFGGTYAWEPARFAEMIWLLCERNIRDSLSEIPVERKHLVSFEDLVKQPRDTIGRLCDFIGTDYTKEMLDPYEDKPRRMTSFAGMKVLGDDKFNNYTSINPSVADLWQDNADSISLGTQTKVIARYLGYDVSMCPAPRSDLYESAKEVVDRNSSVADYSTKPLVHIQFERTAAHSPDSIAAVSTNKKISFKQLNEDANRIAHAVLSNGAQKNQVIAIYLPRGLDIPKAILATLKSGCAFVVLDPEHPAGRLVELIKEVQPYSIITLSTLTQQLTTDSSKLLLLDEICLEGYSSKNPATVTSSSDLAYIVFTSGSTGIPKGVLVEHGSLINYVCGVVERYRLTPADRRSQCLSISGDVLVSELFPAWYAGGSVGIIECLAQMTVQQMLQAVDELEITVHGLPSSLWHQWTDRLEDSKLNLPQRLRLLLVGLETVRADKYEIWRKYIGTRIEMINCYGPTETTVTCVYHTMDPNRSYSSLASIPIGRPLANVKLYVLDKDTNPVPFGNTGELYISGPGVARGYVSQSELSKDHFLPDPFSDDPDAKMYRTGDLVYYLDNESLVHAGRTDDQVKIRGYRVDLVEVEEIIKQHPLVNDCVAALSKDCSGSEWLIGYLVITRQQELKLEQLRQFLKERIPNYMIPAAFMTLKNLPIGNNGKIDRKALPVPRRIRQPAEDSYVAPVTQTEQRLAEIWKLVLKLEGDVGLYDDFFDLGGDSLSAMQVIEEIATVLGQELPAETLFHRGTIFKVAEFIDQRHESAQIEAKDIATAVKQEQLSVPPLAPEIYHQLIAYTSKWKGRRLIPDALVIGLNTAGHLRPLYWCCQSFAEFEALAQHLGMEQPVYGMRSGHLVMEKTIENVRAIAGHYVKEIQTIQAAGPYLLGGNCQAGTIAWEMARQLRKKNESVALLCLLDKFIPEPYPGRLASFFGRESPFNPYHSFHDPIKGWRKLYTGGFSLDLIPGNHGQYFQSPSIRSFADRLRVRIEQSTTGQFPPTDTNSDLARLPENAYQAEISVPDAISASPGELRRIIVRVENQSAASWPAFEKSGLTLANSWYNLNGECLQRLDAVAELPHDLLSGEKIKIELVVTMPKTAGVYQLQLDLVEQGITWFAEKGSIPAMMKVHIADIA